MITGVWLVLLGGVLLFARSVSDRRPLELPAVLAIVGAFFFGPLSALWGLWGMLGSLLNIGWLTSFPIYWVTFLIMGICQAAGGAALSLRAITLIAKLEVPRLREALLITGIASISCGIWSIVATLLFPSV